MSSIKKSAEVDDDEDDHPNTIVLARKDDSYVLEQVNRLFYICKCIIFY